ncbi:MAG: hypothetical protein K8I27_11225 [Planctomycetes bacterium]|nr:hypothetical protein [Planctomycetota bacterium]
MKDAEYTLNNLARDYSDQLHEYVRTKFDECRNLAQVKTLRRIEIAPVSTPI